MADKFGLVLWNRAKFPLCWNFNYQIAPNRAWMMWSIHIFNIDDISGCWLG